MNDTAYNDYILIKASPVISDYDDRKITHYGNSYQPSHQPQNNSNRNTFALNDFIESAATNGSNGHLVTTRQLLNSQRPRSLDKIEMVPAVVYGPLPFS